MSTPTSECKKSSLTVKIYLPDDKEHVLAVNFPNSTTIEKLKEEIAKKFKVSPDDFVVLQNDEEIFNDVELFDLFLNEFGIVEIKLKLTDDAVDEGIALDTSVYYSSFTLSEIITVHVPIENEEGEEIVKDLMVEIENKSIKKPFIGGFVHKKTSKKFNYLIFLKTFKISLDIEYHHAFTQTGPTEEQIHKLLDEKTSRDTQTAVIRINSTITMKDQATQNFGEANESLFMEKTSDHGIKPNEKYENFEELQKRKNIEGKVKLIQKNFRCYRLKVCIKEKAAEYRQLMARKKKREERIKQEYINTHKKSGDFPKTKKDFDSLFAQISAWKENEVKILIIIQCTEIQLIIFRLNASHQTSPDQHVLLKCNHC